MLYGKPTWKFFWFFYSVLWAGSIFVQAKTKDSIQGCADLRIIVCRHITHILYVCYFHVIQGFHAIFNCKVCPILIQLCLQQPVDQQCSIADHEVGDNTLWLLMVYRTCAKVCFHYPEAVFNLISAGADFRLWSLPGRQGLWPRHNSRHMFSSSSMIFLSS